MVNSEIMFGKKFVFILYSAVQHERAPRNKKDTKTHPQFSPYPTTVIYRRLPVSNSSTSAEIPAPNGSSLPRERASILKDHPGMSNAVLSPRGRPELIHHHGKAHTLTPPPTPKHKPLIRNSTELYKLCVQLLYESITWARNIPTFSYIPLEDQALLLENCWSEIFLLYLSQLSIPLEIDHMVKLAREGFNSNKKDWCETDDDVSIDSYEGLVRIQSIIEKFKQLKLKPTEFACIKAIVLFKPGKKLEKRNIK